MKKIISLILAVAVLCSMSVFAHPFSDVSNHWAEDEIEKAYSNNIVNGDPDGRFRPDDNITRAEFLKMVVSAICTIAGVEIPEEFGNDSHWASKYHAFAKVYVFTQVEDTVNGINPGTMFSAEEYDADIQRWEMAFMASEAVSALIDVEAPSAVKFGFDDAKELETLPDIIVSSVANCNNFSIMNGDDKNLFRPNAKGTRAEAVAVVNRLELYVIEEIIAITTAQQEAEKVYNEGIEKNLVTYDEIPTGHPVVTFVMENNKKFSIELYPEYAPQTVANFVKLAKDGFYKGLTFHRIIEGFMAQGGDPEGTGMGGSGKSIKGEFLANGFEGNTLSHERGTVSMARSNHPDSASSQFFICYDDAAFLDGQYAAFGKVISGMDVVDGFCKVELVENEIGEIASPKDPIVIKSVTVAQKK